MFNGAASYLGWLVTLGSASHRFFRHPSFLSLLPMPKPASQKGSSIGLIDAKGAVDRATAQTYTDNVFLFVPNLIGSFSPQSSEVFF